MDPLRPDAHPKQGRIDPAGIAGPRARPVRLRRGCTSSDGFHPTNSGENRRGQNTLVTTEQHPTVTTRLLMRLGLQRID